LLSNPKYKAALSQPIQAEKLVGCIAFTNAIQTIVTIKKMYINFIVQSSKKWLLAYAFTIRCCYFGASKSVLLAQRFSIHSRPAQAHLYDLRPNRYFAVSLVAANEYILSEC